MAEIITTDHMVESSDRKLRMFVRNKRLADTPAGDPKRTVLFVHGATYASSITFDYAREGRSWMDQMALDGFDIWALDLPGYGKSDRPPEMDASAEDSPPLVDTAHAVRDVERVIDFILAEQDTSKLNLIGYSWGTAISGAVAGANPDKVENLVLYGALWLKAGSAISSGTKPGAYRFVEFDAIRSRWTIGLEESQIKHLIDPNGMAAWCTQAIASDPKSETFSPPKLRAPSGVVKDVQTFWTQGKPTYNPAKIIAPTLVIMGEWDMETTPDQGREVFNRLENARDRQYTIIGRGTHSLLLENNRHALHTAVDRFLKDRH